MRKMLPFLIVLVAVSVSAFAQSTAKPKQQKSSRQVVVYYFHGDFRCPSCMKIEQFTKISVENNFKKQIKSGLVVFKVVNVEEKGNEHYASDYQLYTKSVIVSLVKDNKEIKWKNLTKVWELLRSQEKFTSYIKDEVNLYLNSDKPKPNF